MKHRNFPIILIVLLLVAGLFTALYISNAVPQYNQLVDSAVITVQCLLPKKENAPQEQEPVETEVTAVIEVEAPAPTVTENEPAPEPAPKDVYAFSQDGYTLSSLGEYQWEYRSDFPFVTDPAVTEIGEVFTVTAEPAILRLQHSTGILISKNPCPVYPGEKAWFESVLVYVLTGRDGNEYRFSFDETIVVPYQEEEKASEPLISLFTPGEKAEKAISLRIKEWTTSEDAAVPDVQPYIGAINQEGNGSQWAELLDGEGPFLFVYLPENQGVFQVGLANANGGWLTADAFVAVFAEDGELKQVSMDYVANKPQVKLHMSDSEIYYIVAGWARGCYDETQAYLQVSEAH